jgi:DNA-binding MarR family transcriptional regulator
MPRSSKTRHAPVDAARCGPVLDLNSHIATKVAIFANRLSRSASRFYRAKYGIGVVEWRLMMFIGRAVETRANHICSETDLDKGAVSRSLGTLQRMGIVSVKEDGADSRRNNVALTAKGRALHDELVPIALDRQSELVAELTLAEIEAFTGVIDRLQSKVADGEPGPDEPLPKQRSFARPRPKGVRRQDAKPPRRRASASG